MFIQIRNLELPSSEKLTLFVLATHLPNIFPSTTLIANETGLSRRTVQTSLNNLKQKYMLSDSVQPIKPPVVKSTRKSAIVKEAPVKAEAVESKEKPGTSPVKSEGVQKSPRKKKELSTEERAKRDQKNWEKTVTAIDALDQLELEVEDTGVSGVHSPEYLKFIENPIFEEMAKVQKTIDTLETIIKQKLFEDYMQEDVMELNHQ